MSVFNVLDPRINSENLLPFHFVEPYLNDMLVEVNNMISKAIAEGMTEDQIEQIINEALSAVDVVTPTQLQSIIDGLEQEIGDNSSDIEELQDIVSKLPIKDAKYVKGQFVNPGDSIIAEFADLTFGVIRNPSPYTDASLAVKGTIESSEFNLKVSFMSFYDATALQRGNDNMNITDQWSTSSRVNGQGGIIDFDCGYTRGTDSIVLVTDKSNQNTYLVMAGAYGNDNNASGATTGRADNAWLYVLSLTNSLEVSVDGTIDLSKYATVEQIRQLILSGGEVDPIYSADKPLIDKTIADFGVHQSTDVARWQNAYNTEKMLMDQYALSMGLKEDADNQLDLIGADEVSQFVVPDEFGGRIEIISTNTVSTYTQLFVNNTAVYDTEGIINGKVLEKSYVVNKNDSVHATNVQSITYIPYIKDPVALEYEMVARQVSKTGKNLTATYSFKNDVSSTLIGVYSIPQRGAGLYHMDIEVTETATIYRLTLSDYVETSIRFIFTTNSDITIRENYIWAETVSPVDPAEIYNMETAVTSQNTAIAQNTSNLTNHISDDQDRWQSIVDLISKNTTDMKAWVKNQIAGTNPSYDYTNGSIVAGAGGLLNISQAGSTWVAPMNGSLVCSIGGLLSLGVSVLVNDASVWDSPVYLLGVKVGGGDNPSAEIPINAGDVVSLSNVLSLGTAINVMFYPVSGAV